MKRVLTNGSWHLCTDPNCEKYSFSSSVGKRTWLPGPGAAAPPWPDPRPVPAHAAGPPKPASPSSGEGWEGRGTQTYCSTPSRESQPRRCRRAAGSGVQPPAPHWPPPCRDCGEREGRREGGAAPPRPARNGGGPDPWGRGGCVSPAFSLLSAARRVRPAGCAGLFRAGGPGNAGLLLPVPRGSPRVPPSARCLSAGLWRCRRSPFSPPAVSFRARRRIPSAAPSLARGRCTEPPTALWCFKSEGMAEEGSWEGPGAPLPAGPKAGLAQVPAHGTARCPVTDLLLLLLFTSIMFN